MKYHPVETWDEARSVTGDTTRPGASDGDQTRLATLARSYKVSAAARRLNLKRGTIEEALILEKLDSFVDPEGIVRIPAHAVEAAYEDENTLETIAELETVNLPDIAVATSIDPRTLSKKLAKIGADRRRPEWGEIRGLWGLPKTYLAFQEKLDLALREQQRVYEEQRESQRLSKQ
ncbi:MAG: hypothetical protein AAF125_18035, partial [Chloroflexota bacterium]